MARKTTGTSNSEGCARGAGWRQGASTGAVSGVKTESGKMGPPRATYGSQCRGSVLRSGSRSTSSAATYTAPQDSKSGSDLGSCVGPGGGCGGLQGRLGLNRLTRYGPKTSAKAKNDDPNDAQSRLGGNGVHTLLPVEGRGVVCGGRGEKVET